VIDILAVGVSMRRENAEAGDDGQRRLAPALPLPAGGAARALPGVSASLPYARLTSHSRR